jgi:cell division transport system permease protein
MKISKKSKSKTIARQKMKKRKMLSFSRITRYGINNFVRNSWLSVAATAVMTITLMIIFVVFASRMVLTDTISDLSSKVDMSIYLKTETEDKTGAELKEKIEKLESVRSVRYISAEEARKKIAEENKNNPDVLEAIKEATNKNPATLRVVVSDINDTSELEAFVENDEQIKKNINNDYPPSFAGERRETIKSIGRAVNFIQEIGITIGTIFIAISSLIIFNTIRMAIFNRREEIQMMKLIGADKSFVRGPFLVESVIYGILASLLASGFGIWGLFKASSTLASYQISVEPILGFLTNYAFAIVIGMMIIGSTIGIISSILATGKYLRLS